MNCDPAYPKGSGKVDVWQETVPVRFGSIDKSDRLTLDAVQKKRTGSRLIQTCRSVQ